MKESRNITDGLTLNQKKSVFKIAIELVKADNQIHRNEVALLDDLQARFRLSQEELDATHYISLQEAVDNLRVLPSDVKASVLKDFEQIVRVDNDVDFGENLLLSALKLTLGEDSGKWSGILSVQGVDAEVSPNQMVYLEEDYSPAVHEVFDDENDSLLISKALGDIGFQLFNLSNVKADLEQRWGANETVDSKYDLLQHSVGYLVPSGDKEKIKNLSSILKNLDAQSFYKIVLSRYGIAPDRIASKSFLLLKVRDCYVLDDDEVLHKTIDFLYLDISRDVKKRILSFVSIFDVKVFQLPYEGYYKILFDYLSSESKMMSHIRMDSRLRFYLSDIDNGEIKFESSPQSRSFYLLLLKYGQAGVEQATFAKAIEYLQNLNTKKYFSGKRLDIVSLEADLLRLKAPWADLIYNTIKIYGLVSTKETEDKSFLKYIQSILQHRSSLKNYINNGFSGTVRLANKEQYLVVFNSMTKSYCLPVSPSLFYFTDGEGRQIPVTESPLWKSLV